MERRTIDSKLRHDLPNRISRDLDGLSQSSVSLLRRLLSSDGEEGSEFRVGSESSSKSFGEIWREERRDEEHNE